MDIGLWDSKWAQKSTEDEMARRVREVCRSIRNVLRTGSRRVEASSTTNTVRPMIGAPVRTTVLARIRRCCSSRGAVAGFRRNHRNHKRTVAEQSHPRRRSNSGTWGTRRRRRTRRHRWPISRNLERGRKHLGRCLPVGTCPSWSRKENWRVWTEHNE